MPSKDCLQTRQCIGFLEIMMCMAKGKIILNHFSFDYGDVHFAMLNTEFGSDSMKAQAASLENRL
ncbi:MAG: hypothetical protein ACQEW5_08055 [Bacillota bacterium]